MNNLLLKNFSWSFIGNIIYALSQWILIVVIAQLGSPYDAGLYSLGLAISAPLIMFINFNFGSLQSTDLSSKYGFNTFKIIRVLAILFFLIIFFIIVIFSNYSIEIILILFLIAFSKIIESFSGLYYGLFQYNERLDIVSKSIITRGVIGTLFFGIGYYIFQDLKFALIFMILIWILNLILYDVKNSKEFLRDSSKKIHTYNIMNLLKIGIPLGLIAGISSLKVNIPRIVIENHLSLQELGYFTVIFYLVLVIGKFVISISSAVLPRMASLYKEGNKKVFLKIFYFIILFIAVFSLLIILISYNFGSELLGFAYGKEYSEYNYLLVLIMFYGLFNYLGVAFEIALNAMKIYNFRLFIEIATTLIIIGSSLYFIPQIGLNGAALSLVISAAFKLIFLIILFLVKFIKRKGEN